METGSAGILPDPAGERAIALARLREQRWRLGRLRDDVEETGRRLASQEVGAGWRSPAQRAYADRVAELVGGLQEVWRAVDDALHAADAAIDRVKVAQ
jgi:hypothetical protein